MRTNTALTDEHSRRAVGDESSRPPAVNYRRDWRDRGREARQRLIELNDVFHAVTFVAAEIVARTVPERHWRACARAVARASLTVGRRWIDRTTELLDAFLAGQMPDHLDRRALAASIVAASFEERVFFHKATHDSAWRPDVRRQHEPEISSGRCAGLNVPGSGAAIDTLKPKRHGDALWSA